MHKEQPICRRWQRRMGGAMAAVMLIAGLASCAPSATSPPSPPLPRPTTPYRIGPGDVLELLVWREETVSGPVTVRSDGMISVSLIGDVKAEGLTPEELAADIERRLLKFIEAPKVVVRVGQTGRRYYMMGNINGQGMFELRPNQTLVQAIAVSGGFNTFADRDSIRIIRQGGPQVQPSYDYDRIIAGEDPDVILEPNDTIIVP